MINDGNLKATDDFHLSLKEMFKDVL